MFLIPKKQAKVELEPLQKIRVYLAARGGAFTLGAEVARTVGRRGSVYYER
jgi:hypothetical protein